uniref:Uncharacterized protein n=1 Tax=Dictyoglomus turgidum TaxID=513050 RepID=A0A7C3SQR2_9BACT
MKKPDKNYYVFKPGWIGYASSANLGINSSEHQFILELYLDWKVSLRFYPTGFGIFEIVGQTGQDITFYDRTEHPHQHCVQIYDKNIWSTFRIHHNVSDFSVITILINNLSVYIYIDGIKLMVGTIINLLDFSGNGMKLFNCGYSVNQRFANFLYGVRIWSYNNSMPSLSECEKEIVKRARNPWQRSRVFGDSNLKAEWLLNEDIPINSTVIPNSANPGVGDLPIYPSNTWGNVRQLYKMP